MAQARTTKKGRLDKRCTKSAGMGRTPRQQAGDRTRSRKRK